MTASCHISHKPFLIHPAGSQVMTVLMTRYRSLWLRFSALGLAALCLSINALASPVPLSIKDSAPRTYTVVKGDTL
ncbi:hypothetical protein ACT691_10720 [Vibrio metschnikovii]